MMSAHKWTVPTMLALCAAGCRSSGDGAASNPTPRAEAPAVPAPVAVEESAANAPLAPLADGTLMAKVGQLAPNFVLKDLDGREHTLAQHRGKIVVLEWFNPGCPFSLFAYGEGPLKTLPGECAKQGLVWLTINSEAGQRPTASVPENRRFAAEHGLAAPILLDPAGIVGKSFGAKTTPHLFVVDPRGVLVYQGALDNAPLGTVTDGGARFDYVRDAVLAVQAGKAVEPAETKPYGCAVHYPKP